MEVFVRNFELNRSRVQSKTGQSPRFLNVEKTFFVKCVPAFYTKKDQQTYFIKQIVVKTVGTVYLQTKSLDCFFENILDKVVFHSIQYLARICWQKLHVLSRKPCIAMFSYTQHVRGAFIWNGLYTKSRRTSRSIKVNVVFLF